MNPDQWQDLIQVELTAGLASIRYRSGYYSSAAIVECLSRAERVTSWDLRNDGAFQTLRIEAAPDALEDAVREVFARYHQYPFYPREVLASFRASGAPLMSCVILLTANDLFVANHLIPSILCNSKGHHIEISIVYNGVDADLCAFRQFDVSTSEFGCVSKGYNQGISRSRGKYVAIFHDDCALLDPDWIPKCINLLEGGYIAVTPEIQTIHQIGAGEPLVNAKNVPLVMDRSRLIAMGGYDQTYYIGYEDLDLTYQILAAGNRFSKVELDHRHWNGMSTALMFSPQRGLYKVLFALDLLSMDTILGLRDASFRRLMQTTNSAWIQRKQFCYFLSKFESYWDVIGYRTAHELRARLVNELADAGDLPILTERSAMLGFIREISGQECPVPLKAWRPQSQNDS